MLDGRLLKLEGVRNCRDFGGWRTQGGGQVVDGRLWRSGHFGEATDDDVATLNGLGADFIVDLRRPGERQWQPNRWPGAGRTAVITNDEGDVKQAPHIAFLKQAELTADSVHAFMTEEYVAIPYAPRHAALFGAWFHRLDQTDGAPAVIHCAAGKDRTGVLAALTLTILDVDWETIAADYEATNAANDIERKLPHWQAYIEAQIGRKVPLEALKPFMGVDRRWLETAFATIEARSGSVQAYLEGTLGVDAAMQDRLHAALVIEPSDVANPLEAR
jgi:protein-tyrosine phosphatase